MDDTCPTFKVWMTIVESGWNVWVWLVGVVSRRRVWLVGVGQIYGCGCKEVYRFPHNTYLLLYPLYFAAASLLFVHFLNVFRSCSGTFFVILCNNFSAQYKHIQATAGIPRQPYEGLHIMLYTRRSKHKRTLHILRWTSAVCLQGDI